MIPPTPPRLLAHERAFLVGWNAAASRTCTCAPTPAPFERTLGKTPLGASGGLGTCAASVRWDMHMFSGDRVPQLQQIGGHK